MRKLIFCGASPLFFLVLAVISGDTEKDGSVLPLTVRQSHETLAIVEAGRGAAKKVAWKSIVGRRATIQGIAWRDSKGLGDRVILDGTTLYVAAREPFKETGRLVKVTGIFAKRTMSAGPPESQGFPEAFEYYILADATIESIESVSSPRVVVTER
jgi:hypothetical protein